jgi:hypothetical protein
VTLPFKVFNQQCVNLLPNHAKIHIPETSPAAKFTEKKAQWKGTGDWGKICLIQNKPRLKIIPNTPTTGNTIRKHLDAYQRKYLSKSQ